MTVLHSQLRQAVPAAGRPPLTLVPRPADSTAELLAGNLDRQADMHARLLDLARRQTEAIRSRDPQLLEEVLHEIDHTLLDRMGLEMQRNQLVGRVAVDLGIEATEVDLARVCGMASADVAARLNAASTRLRSLLAELEPVVKTNRALMEQEIELIDGIVRMATTSSDASPTYERPGEAGAPHQSRSLLDLQG